MVNQQTKARGALERLFEQKVDQQSVGRVKKWNVGKWKMENGMVVEGKEDAKLDW